MKRNAPLQQEPTVKMSTPITDAHSALADRLAAILWRKTPQTSATTSATTNELENLAKAKPHTWGEESDLHLIHAATKGTK